MFSALSRLQYQAVDAIQIAFILTGNRFLKKQMEQLLAAPNLRRGEIQSSVTVLSSRKIQPDCARTKLMLFVDICAAKMSLDIRMSTSSSISVSVSSYRTRWYTWYSLSSTVSDSCGELSPRKMNEMSPRSHRISEKSTSVVSNRIELPALWMRQMSDGNIRDTNGTVYSQTATLKNDQLTV